MKVKPLELIPESSVASVAYQVFSDGIPLDFRYKDKYLETYTITDIHLSLIVDDLYREILAFAKGLGYPEFRLVGAIDPSTQKYTIWYLSSFDIVLPWTTYYTKLSLCSNIINTPPILFGPYSFFKNIDFECLNTDLGNSLIVHNMDRASSFIYQGKIL